MRKILCTVLFILLPIISYAGDINSQPLRKEIRAQAQQLYRDAKNNQKLSANDRVYQYSMPLLAASVVDRKLYRIIEIDMLRSLKKMDAKSMQAWMLGRLILAAQQARMPAKVAVYQLLLENVLVQDTLPKDVMTGWAIGYLAAVDRQTYDKYRNDLWTYLNRAKAAYQNDNSQDNLTNLLWTITMNISAAAKVKHDQDYVDFFNTYTQASGMSPLTEVIRAMLLSDYQAWLLSVNSLAAHRMQQHAQLQLFNNLLTITLQNPAVGNADRMLANVSRLRSD